MIYLIAENVLVWEHYCTEHLSMFHIIAKYYSVSIDPCHTQVHNLPIREPCVLS